MSDQMHDESTVKVSFMRSLCMGKIEQDLIFPFPEMKQAESDLLKQIFESIHPWLSEHEGDFRVWDRTAEMPEPFVAQLKQMGLFGLIVPENFGGMQLSSTGYSRMIQQLARYDGSVAITVGAHCSIGMRGLVLFGTPEQKAKYLPKLATGELVAAFCLTEAGAGSDAASITTKAVKIGTEWVLSGEKLWITNGGIASFYTVFARTDSPEGKITAFIVTPEQKGVSTGPHEDKMGLRASSTTTVHFDEVRLSQDNVLGGVGQGFKVAMQILNSGRSGLGGGCVGTMKKLIELSTKQAAQRVQFGEPIATYGLIKEKIANMVVDCYASESVVNMVSGLVDQGCADYAVEAAISKVFATECLWRTVDEALQVAGGNGYMCEFPYERILRDCRVYRIFEGTNDILRLFIALTAMNDVGVHLSELSASLEGIFSDPIKGFGLLSDYGRRRISQVTGIGGSHSSLDRVHPLIKKQAELFEEGVRALAGAVDANLRKYGKKIIGKQLVSKRLADGMIDLFVFACILSRVSAAIDASLVNQKSGLKGDQSSESLETQKLSSKRSASESSTQQSQVPMSEDLEQQIEILTVYSKAASARMKVNFSAVDESDDDRLRSIANHALAGQKYNWDNLQLT